MVMRHFEHTVNRKTMRRLILPLTLGIALTAIPAVATAATSVAFVDPDDGRWYVPDGSGSHTSFAFGDPGDTPISGDWDCNGIDTPGRFSSDGYFYLRNSSGSGDPDIAFHFGARGDRPLVGDWDGDGCDTVAVYRPSESTVYAADRLGVHPAWREQPVVGTPIVADLDGDRREEVAGYRDGFGLVFVNGDVVPGRPLEGDWFFDGRSIGTTGDYAIAHAVSGLTPVPGTYGAGCRSCAAGRPALDEGDTGAWVAELRAALAALGFRPGEGDEYDTTLAAAVVAFEKYHGLERDGVFGQDHWALLDKAIAIPYRADTPTRVEVDLGRQILFLVVDHQPAGIIPVSSANGDTYTSWNGNTVTARTPEGEFSFYREGRGWYRSYLGRLYEPFFFKGGYAIHGSNSVPAYPASHGCIRTRIVDQDWLKPQLEMGMPVFVYGQRTEAPSAVPVDSHHN
jgi:peptidoglycan hydrolase-like protein with peptidoglycan-binding domain